jgi:hypothetical protein
MITCRAHRHVRHGDQSSMAVAIATGSPQDESVQCADLWPVQLKAAFLYCIMRRRPPGPLL